VTITVGRSALADVDLVFALGADNLFAFRYNTSDGSTLTPVDLTGYSARSHVRGHAGALLLDLTPFIVLGGILGTVNIPVPAASTENLRSCGDARWDLELTDPGGGVVRFAQGRVGISADVTR
jgi:hypothetical protein